MPNNYFEFKQFRIDQEGAAMKVGTDGVLLGAWAQLDGTERRILDIGTGTGVLTLMAAQRTPAHIDAVEIDEPAAEQARKNAAMSPWPERVAVHAVAVQDFAGQATVRYDHILSNPPFFVNSLKAPDASRSAARHTDNLSFEDLIGAILRLLQPDGRFSVIYPVEEAAVFERTAIERGLYPCRKTGVRGHHNAPVKRILMELSWKETIVEENELVIETGRHQYTDEYIHLTKDFYLKF